MIMMPYNCSSHRCSSQAAQTSGTPQARCWPVAGSQIRAVPSPPPPVASQAPSGAIATAVTQACWAT
jgi:hypothetical protein